MHFHFIFNMKNRKDMWRYTGVGVFFRSGKIYLPSLHLEDGYGGKRSKEKKKMCDFVTQGLIQWYFHFTCHRGLAHAKQLNDDWLLFLNRYDFCSNNEESFILDSDSNTGNRIESITQRTAVIEGKNKVFFVKISTGIFILKTHTELPILGLLEPEVIQMLKQKFWEKKDNVWDTSSWTGALRRLKLRDSPADTSSIVTRTWSQRKRRNCLLDTKWVPISGSQPWLHVRILSHYYYISASGLGPGFIRASREVLACSQDWISAIHKVGQSA